MVILQYPLMFIPEETHRNFINHTAAHLQCRSNYFSIRTIKQWNQLPDEIIRCNTLNSFKSEIDNNY